MKGGKSKRQGNIPKQSPRNTSILTGAYPIFKATCVPAMASLSNVLEREAKSTCCQLAFLLQKLRRLYREQRGAGDSRLFQHAEKLW